MGLTEILLLALGLSADAFAVAVCKGLSVKKVTVKNIMICGAWFGSFQALMPFIGYFLAYGFEKYVQAFSHWIAFGLLSLIGINMIKEVFSKEEEKPCCDLDIKTMFMLAVATSIDALAVGITFAFEPVNIFDAGSFVNMLVSVILIGVITFVISSLGVKIGSIFGSKYKKPAEIAGGVILVLLGIKIVLEHFNII